MWYTTNTKMKIKNKSLILTLLILIAIPITLADVPAWEQFPYLQSSIVNKPQNLNTNSFYSVSLYSGAFEYEYPILVPIGTNGLTPIIKLNYNSHSTSALPSVVGTAWNLNDNYIKRNINYTLTNLNDDYFELTFNGVYYKLIYVPSENRFHTERETYFLITNLTNGNNTKGQYWLLKTKDGTNYRFGYNNESELLSNQYDFVSKWSLDLINDTSNNNIFYSYSENTYGDSGSVYLTKIEYNNDKNRTIYFTYEMQNRTDSWIYYDQGNKIKQSRRLSEIIVNTTTKIIRTYKINYEDSLKTKTFIKEITLYGENNTNSLPPTKFAYSGLKKGWTNSSKWLSPECGSEDSCFIESRNFDNGVRLADLNGDGLVDIIRGNGEESPPQTFWMNSRNGYFIEYEFWHACSNEPIDGCFVDEFYNDTGVRIMNVNGDAYPDLLRAHADIEPYSKVWLNEYWGFNDFNNLISPECESSDTTSCFTRQRSDYVKENGVRIADVNGDGLDDLIYGNADDNPHASTWINNGSGWKQDSKWKIPECTSTTSVGCFVRGEENNDNGVRLADLNGDGLVDIIRATRYSSPYYRTWINNGTGWRQDTTWDMIQCNDSFSNCFVDSDYDDRGLRLVDLNGDGLTDIFRTSNNYGMAVWLNNGSGWITDNSWLTYSCLSSNYNNCFIRTGSRDNGIRLGDLNGDGLLDIMKANEFNNPSSITLLNNASKAYLLMNITTESGGIIKVDYIQSTYVLNTNYSARDNIPFNLWLVSNITKTSNLPTVETEFYQYDYDLGNYNSKEREFRGFGYVIEKRSDSAIEHWYHQNNSMKGLEYKNQINNSLGKTLKSINYIYSLYNSPSPIIYNPLLSRQIETDYNNTNNISKEIRYTYDQFGNVITVSYIGDNSLQGDEKYEYYEYLNNSASWIINKPRRYYLLDQDNSTMVKQIWYKYDNQQYNHPPIKGLVTSEIKYLNNTLNITTGYGYNDYGNKINQTDPNGLVTKYTYGSVEKTFTYQDALINPLSYIINYTYDLGTGNLINVRDQNGIYTNYTYDSFGRITKEIKPYDSIEQPTKTYEYGFDGIPPEKIKYSEKTENNNYINTYTFYDGFNKIIQTKKDSDNSLAYYNNNTIMQQSLGSSISATINHFEFQGLKNSTQSLISYYTLVNFTSNENYNLSTLSMYVAGFNQNQDGGDSPYFHVAIHNVNSTGGIGSQIGQNSSETYISYNQPGFYNVSWFSGNKPSIVSGNSYWIIWENTSYQDAHYFRLGETEGTYNIWYTLNTPNINGIPQNSSYKINTLNIKLWGITNSANNNSSYQITNDLYYDSAGRIINKSNLYISPYSENYFQPDQNIFKTSYSYDALDRVTLVKNPDGTNKTSLYNLWTIYMYDENNHKKTNYLDAYGRISKVIEEYNYNSEYTYNTLDQLVSIKDSINNTINITYDLLGRKTKLIDPDLGIWLYYYDSNNNLIKQTDSRNISLYIVYDSINRIRYKNNSLGIVEYYIYDSDKKGVLSTSLLDDIAAYYSYDNRLRKTGGKNIIDSINFITNWTYDSMDRISSIKYPNGEIVKFNYNNQNEISSINGILNNITYNENSQITSRVYNNSITTNYEYNNTNFRLTDIQISDKQDLSYLYDKVGNIIKITDSINSGTETMSYDNLDRLITSAKIVNSVVMFNYTYNYNSIGNIINATNNGISKNYIYGTYPIHSPISIIEITN